MLASPETPGRSVDSERRMKRSRRIALCNNPLTAFSKAPDKELQRVGTAGFLLASTKAGRV